MITSAAIVTLDGVDYDPLDFTVGCDNAWSPTWKADVTLARRDLQARTSNATNLVTNPSAALDLTDAVAGSATLVRQTGIYAFGTMHGTAYRLNCTAAASQVTLGGDYGGLRLGMQAGKTYTVSATFYVDAPLSGTENAQSRQLAIGCVAPSMNGGVSFYLALSDKAPNVGGTQTRVSLTFTVPRDATSVVLRAFAGHSAGSAYWADFMLVEGNGVDSNGRTIDPFDGDSIDNAVYTYDWTGAAHKSASTRTRTYVNNSGPVVDPRMYPSARVRWWFGEDPAPLVLDATLTVRSYIPDEFAGTVRLTLMSDEVKLQDYKNASTADYSPGAMTLQAMVGLAMRKIGNALYDKIVFPATLVPATATVWRAGDSLDSWLQGPLRSAGIELYQDCSGGFPPAFRAFNLNDPGKSSVYGTRGFTKDQIVSSPVGIDMDADGYADAVVLTYAWTDAAGASQRKVYASLPAGAFHKVLAKSFSTPDPGVDPAPATRAYTSKAGYTASLTIIPSTRPAPPSYAEAPMSLGDTVSFNLPSGSAYTANVDSIQWSYPEDRMTLGLTNVVYAGLGGSPF